MEKSTSYRTRLSLHAVITLLASSVVVDSALTGSVLLPVLAVAP